MRSEIVRPRRVDWSLSALLIIQAVTLFAASTRNDDDASLATRLRHAPPPAHASIRGAYQLTS